MAPQFITSPIGIYIAQDGRFKDDKVVTISLTYRSLSETEAVIRVGVLREKEAALIAKDEIEEVPSKEK